MLHKVCVDVHTPFQNSLTERKRVSMIKLSEGWELTPNQQTYHIFIFQASRVVHEKSEEKWGEGEGTSYLAEISGIPRKRQLIKVSP